MPSSSGRPVSFARGSDEAAGEDGLDLGAEDQAVVADGPVERLDAEPVAREQQPPARGVPDGEREHAAEAVHAVVAPLLVRVDDRLGVAARVIAMARRFELRAQVRVVVDLAVEDDLDRAVLVAERLRSRREIDDAQPAVPERGDGRRTRRPLRRGRGARSRRACAAAAHARPRAARRWRRFLRCRTCSGRSPLHGRLRRRGAADERRARPRALPRGPAALVGELPEPQLQHQQLPQAMAVIGLPGAVLVEQPLTRRPARTRRARDCAGSRPDPAASAAAGRAATRQSAPQSPACRARAPPRAGAPPARAGAGTC